MRFEIDLPDWAEREYQRLSEPVGDLVQRMRLVIRFAELNVEHGTGGPFAAGVFEQPTGRLIAVGVNRVVPLNLSSAHAEIVALSFAQTKLGTYDLGGAGMPKFQLVVSARPCAMCCGAIAWSGVRSLVVGAGGREIVTETEFDEGPVHPDWQHELRRRGIEVVEDILTDDAAAVLRRYARAEGLIYNSRSHAAPVKE
jgi:tRNA(Arg) A34 adenosine deaminase TadA